MAEDTFAGGSSNDTFGDFSGGGLSDLVSQIGGALISGAKYLTERDSADKQNSILTGSYAGAADRLNRGYDERLLTSEQGADELIKLLTAGLKDTTGLYRNAAFDYGDRSGQAVDKYAAWMKPILEQLTRGLSASDDLYGAQLNQSSDQYANQMEPYVAGGDEALGILRGILGSDPNQLTPEQKLMVSDFMREMNANLAASGLRGAGRAGVAAFNEGLGRTKAALFKQNQDRRDAAARTLADKGFTANSNVAENRYKTGAATAGNTFDVNSAIAKTAYGQGQDVGSKRYAVDQNVAQTLYNTDKGIGQLTDKYYSDVGNITSDRYANRGNTIFGKAQVDASTGLNKGRVNAATDALLTGLDTNALDKLGTILTQKNSAAAKGL